MLNHKAAYNWDLFWMLARTEFRLRDQGTWIGFLWTLLHPLFLFGVLYLMFTRWMAPQVPHYAAFLLIGIVQWNFFASATTAGLTSLRRKAGLVSSYAFPRVLVVLSSVFAVLLSHLLEWTVLLAAVAALGVKPTAAWLALPFLVTLELALVTGLACLLSVLAVDLRDLDHAWGLFLYGLFFLTPVFYAAEAVGGAARFAASLNPLALVIGATRAALLGGPWSPSPGAWALAAGTAAFCAAAVASHGRMSRGIAERL